jgi:hypothetical protein
MMKLRTLASAFPVLPAGVGAPLPPHPIGGSVSALQAAVLTFQNYLSTIANPASPPAIVAVTLTQLASAGPGLAAAIADATQGIAATSGLPSGTTTLLQKYASLVTAAQTAFATWVAAPTAANTPAAVSDVQAIIQNALSSVVTLYGANLLDDIKTNGCPGSPAVVNGFQTAYNALVPDLYSTLPMSGVYDAATQAALDNVLPGQAIACPTAGGGGLPPLPPITKVCPVGTMPGAGGTCVAVTPVVAGSGGAASSNTALYVAGGALVLGGLAWWMYANRAKRNPPAWYTEAPSRALRQRVGSDAEWVGKRVQLHPGLDRWMMGDRYGVVVRVHRTKPGVVFVHLDRSGKTLPFRAVDLTTVY